MQFPGADPMKKISQEKRNHLIVVGAITAVTLGVIYFFLIQPQYDSLSKIAREKKAADTKLASIKSTITNSATMANNLSATTANLIHTEEDLASGDLYSWTYDTLRRFKQQYRVEIPDLGHPTTEQMDLLPSFPYKQIRFAINGTAYYHDLGKFIADLENNFPHIRVVHLLIEPIPGTDNSNEKLSFRMEIIALVKNPS
jgi:Tfp pilus assembly protein PilO